MESLIYDRTLSDITNLTSKGQYNASDLNRVESWTKYLNDKFNELGYRTGNIKIYGKNVFNPSMFDGLTVNADGTVKTTKYYKDSVATTLTLEPNTEYTIRTFINGVSSTNVGFSLEVNGTWVNYTLANFKTDENGKITLRVGAVAYASIGTANFDVLMRKTTDANVYVPYKEPVVGYKERKINNYLDYDYISDFSNVIYSTYHFAEIKNLKPNTDYTIDNINEDYFKELQNKYTLGDFTICLTKSLRFNDTYTYLRMSGTNISSKKNFTTNDTGTAYIAIYVGGTMSVLSNEEKWNESIKLFENARIYETNSDKWQTKDDFTIDEADRIINNINVLRSVIALYNDTPETPETMRFLDYIKANNIEKILFDMDKLVNNMVNTFRYSGTFYSGEVGLC